MIARTKAPLSSNIPCTGPVLSGCGVGWAEAETRTGGAEAEGAAGTARDGTDTDGGTRGGAGSGPALGTSAIAIHHGTGAAGSRGMPGGACSCCCCIRCTDLRMLLMIDATTPMMTKMTQTSPTISCIGYLAGGGGGGGPSVCAGPSTLVPIAPRISVSAWMFLRR
jgi:hypothetical protein